MRKILFLDIDGVLMTFPEEPESEIDMFSSTALANLETICEAIPELEIVISSSWRIGRTIEDLRSVFIQNKFKYPDRIVSVTPRIFKFRSGYKDQYSSAPRGCDISAWLDDNMYSIHPEFTYQEELLWRDANPFNYVILDDDGDMLYDQRHHFIQTDTRYGITGAHVTEILNILK